MSDGKRDSSLVTRLARYRRLWPIALCLLLGIVLLLGAGEKGEGRVTDGAEDGALLAYQHALEAELAALCSSVEGVGECRVRVTLARGEQTVYQGSRVEAVYPPVVEAVTVVCEGGGSERVRARLCDMLSSLYSIGTHRIAVLPLKK